MGSGSAEPAVANVHTRPTRGGVVVLDMRANRQRLTEQLALPGATALCITLLACTGCGGAPARTRPSSARPLPTSPVPRDERHVLPELRGVEKIASEVAISEFISAVAFHDGRVAIGGVSGTAVGSVSSALWTVVPIPCASLLVLGQQELWCTSGQEFLHGPVKYVISHSQDGGVTWKVWYPPSHGFITDDLVKCTRGSVAMYESSRERIVQMWFDPGSGDLVIHDLERFREPTFGSRADPEVRCAALTGRETPSDDRRFSIAHSGSEYFLLEESSEGIEVRRDKLPCDGRLDTSGGGVAILDCVGRLWVKVGASLKLLSVGPDLSDRMNVRPPEGIEEEEN